MSIRPTRVVLIGLSVDTQGSFGHNPFTERRLFARKEGKFPEPTNFACRDCSVRIVS